MVAINRRASFRPHTDAGTGLGQSLSLIVGLGDYTGGGLAVEGASVPIRYAPHEFDGWRSRHWTLPFEVSSSSKVLLRAVPAGLTQCVLLYLLA